MGDYYEKECVRLNDQVRKQQIIQAELHGEIARQRREIRELEDALLRGQRVIQISIGGKTNA